MDFKKRVDKLFAELTCEIAKKQYEERNTKWLTYELHTYYDVITNRRKYIIIFDFGNDLLIEAIISKETYMEIKNNESLCN